MHLPTVNGSDSYSYRVEPLHVLDLPQLYTRPPATELLSTLARLATKASSWDVTENGQEHEGGEIEEDGVPKYLTGIIASPLAWIEDENIKEQIWEAAGAKLSERSGRTAIPSAFRTFVIPGPASPQSKSTDSTISITLHEPSLTADNLGHKTWVASYLLAKRLFYLLPSLPVLCTLASNSFNDNKIQEPRILELGAGTGLVGIAAAALFHARVHLTDLPDIVPNLLTNVSSNESLFEHSGGSASAGVLDWSDLPLDVDDEEKYDLILATDPLYSPQHPPWLVQAIGKYLKQQKEARVVIELPLREAYAPEIEDLKRRMEGLGLETIAQGEESGFDDWGAHRTERQAVTCWWGVWAWASQ